MSTDKQQKTGPPQIIRLDKAFKLAEQWVNNMTKDAEDEPIKVDPEARPPRLGLGSKFVRQSKVGHLSDPVERKLHAKLEAGKRKAAKTVDEHGGNDNDDDNEDSDEELESRNNAFAKKIKGPPPSSSLQVKKKQK